MDWSSSENHVFINPRLPLEERTQLMKVVDYFKSEFKSHVFLLSSGTTAQTVQDFKWIALSKTALLNSADAVNRHLISNSSDVWLHTLPSFHVGGLGIWARSYLSRSSVIELPQWNCEDFFRCILEHQITLTSLVPAQIFDLVTKGYTSPKHLRAVLVGGGALAPSLHEKALALGWPLLTTYGMTETCSQIATDRMESLGRSPAMKVLDHLDVQTIENGRLRIRGESLLTAYLYRDGNQWVIQDPKEDGWFLTQDRGILDGKNLQILGRIGDFVKIGGESVEMGRLNPILDEIRVRLQIKSDIAILPVPDDRLGHVIHLISDRLFSEEKASELVSQFNARVLAFEKIRNWRRLERIPRTPLGKLVRAECVKLILEL